MKKIAKDISMEQVESIFRDLSDIFDHNGRVKIRGMLFYLSGIYGGDIRKSLKKLELPIEFSIDTEEEIKTNDDEKEWQKQNNEAKRLAQKEFPKQQLIKLRRMLNAYFEDDGVEIGNYKIKTVEPLTVEDNDYNLYKSVKVEIVFSIKVTGELESVEREEPKFKKGNVIQAERDTGFWQNHKFHKIVNIVWNEDEFDWDYRIKPLSIEGKTFGKVKVWNGKFEGDLYEETVKDFVKKFDVLNKKLVSFARAIPKIVDKLVELSDNAYNISEIDKKNGEYNVHIGVKTRYTIAKFEVRLSQMIIVMKFTRDERYLSDEDIFNFDLNKAKKDLAEQIKSEMPYLTETYGGAQLKDAGNFKEVIDLIKDMNTWFDKEMSTTHINLTTRENGDIGSETAGKEDIREGNRIIKEIRSKFSKDKVSIEAEVVDEWVHIDIRPKG